MKEPKDIKVTLELNAAECGHLVVGMHQVISNHLEYLDNYSRAHPGEIDEEEDDDAVKDYEALRDKIKAKLKEVGIE